MIRQYVELHLTCGSEAEAMKIAEALLTDRLIACSKFSTAASKFWWKNELTDAQEVLMIMDSALDLFDEIEAALTKLHSYETFVLTAIPLGKVSTLATKWIEDNLRQPLTPSSSSLSN